MSINIVTPNDWAMGPPRERGSHQNMRINDRGPFCCLLEEKPHSYTATHSHSEPEIFVVLDGRMLFNGQWVGKGTVIHVPADEDYWYSTSEEHCIVMLTRPGERGEKHDVAEATTAG